RALRGPALRCEPGAGSDRSFRPFPSGHSPPQPGQFSRAPSRSAVAAPGVVRVALAPQATQQLWTHKAFFELASGEHMLTLVTQGGVVRDCALRWKRVRRASITVGKNMTGQFHLFLKTITGLVVATAATTAVAQKAATTAVAQKAAPTAVTQKAADTAVAQRAATTAVTQKAAPTAVTQKAATTAVTQKAATTAATLLAANTPIDQQAVTAAVDPQAANMPAEPGAAPPDSATAAVDPQAANIPAEPGAAPPDSATQLQGVVVTGSRIARRDYESNVPIVTVGSAAIKQTGEVSLEMALQQLPQFMPDMNANDPLLSNGGRAQV